MQLGKLAMQHYDPSQMMNYFQTQQNCNQIFDQWLHQCYKPQPKAIHSVQLQKNVKSILSA